MFFQQSKFKANREKTILGGYGSMLSQKKSEILDGVIAFLVLFEQIWIKLFASHWEFFTKYDVSRLHIFNLCVLTSGQEYIQKMLVGNAILN